LHVSEPANFTGRMLTGPARPGPVITWPGPARWFFKIIEPGPNGSSDFDMPVIYSGTHEVYGVLFNNSDPNPVTNPNPKPDPNLNPNPVAVRGYLPPGANVCVAARPGSRLEKST